MKARTYFSWLFPSAGGLGPVLLLTLLLLWPAGCAKRPPTPEPAQEGLELLLLHTNDTHSYAAGIDKYGNACFDDAPCRGGMARIAAAIKEHKARADNVLALDAGDQFQGTLFYSVNKWPMLAAMGRHMPYDAVTLGNHEFDEGCAELQKYLGQLNYPVLAANLKPQEGCPLARSTTPPWSVREVRGVKVGIVGLANDDVRTLSSACPQTHFDDTATALRRAVSDLEARGVRHIVALTHLGLPADRELARSVDGVDVIVGGHSHSYLGPGSKEGPYPVVEKSPSGKDVLVVSAKNATQYLGELTVTFDQTGVPLRWSGQARELAPSDPGDPVIRALVKKYAKPLNAYRKQKVGSHNLRFADGLDACREGDCLGGMLSADAMLEYARPHGAVLALCNGGAIRAAIAPGTITRGDLLAVIPFSNILELRQYSGEQIRRALEHGVAEEGGKGPRILQVAGLRYGIDPSKPAGSRIVSVETLDSAGTVAPLDPKATYRAVLPNYLARGGDGFTVLAEGKAISSANPVDIDVVEAYIKKHSPLPMPQTGRINFVQ